MIIIKPFGKDYLVVMTVTANNINDLNIIYRIIHLLILRVIH